MVSSKGISVEDLYFSIGDFAMSGLSFEVHEGEYFVLTGPNGSGKTVLIRLISGLYFPDSGQVRIQGRVVTNLPPWRRGVGYVPQEGILFPNRNVRDNIRFGLEVRRTRKARVKEEVEKAAGMLGIEYLLDRTVDGLSGGETQKVSLARALVLNPSVLLLDEPVSAIDEESRDEVCHQLRRIQRELGITTLHVSHNRRETHLVADRVGVIRDGVLEGTGTVDEMLPPKPAPRQQSRLADTES